MQRHHLLQLRGKFKFSQVDPWYQAVQETQASLCLGAQVFVVKSLPRWDPESQPDLWNPWLQEVPVTGGIWAWVSNLRVWGSIGLLRLVSSCVRREWCCGCCLPRDLIWWGKRYKNTLWTVIHNIFTSLLSFTMFCRVINSKKTTNKWICALWEPQLLGPIATVNKVLSPSSSTQDRSSPSQPPWHRAFLWMNSSSPMAL